LLSTAHKVENCGSPTTCRVCQQQHQNLNLKFNLNLTLLEVNIEVIKKYIWLPWVKVN